LDGDKFAGFCYIETWQEKGFVANSGLIVVEEYVDWDLQKPLKTKLSIYRVKDIPIQKYSD
jgi:hypothetical protein